MQTARRRLYGRVMKTKPASKGQSPVVWRGRDGKPVACVEKLKVLSENLEEIRQQAQDALEDAMLMGCDEAQFREVLRDLVARLDNPYRRVRRN